MSEAIQLNTEDFAALVRWLGSSGHLLDRPSLSQREVIAPLPADHVAPFSHLVKGNSHPFLRFDPGLWTEYGGFAGWKYQILIDTVSILQDVPDALGYTYLTEHEAAQIRSCGFWAAAGLWEVPALPHELVAGNGLLECLSDWSLEANRRVPLHGSASCTMTPGWIKVELQGMTAPPADLTSVQSPDEKRILSLLPKQSGVMLKRRLQQGLWRMGSRRYKSALRSLERRGEVTVDRKWVKRAPVTCGSFSRHPADSAGSGASTASR